MNRHDRGTASLSGGHHTWLELAAGPTRAIGREGDRSSGLKLAHGAQQGTSSSAGAGSSDGAVPQGLGEVGKVLAVPGLAHHDGHALVPVLPKQREQDLVPEEEDMRPSGVAQRPPALLMRHADTPG